MRFIFLVTTTSDRTRKSIKIYSVTATAGPLVVYVEEIDISSRLVSPACLYLLVSSYLDDVGGVQHQAGQGSEYVIEEGEEKEE